MPGGKDTWRIVQKVDAITLSGWLVLIQYMYVCIYIYIYIYIFIYTNMYHIILHDNVYKYIYII